MTVDSVTQVIEKIKGDKSYVMLVHFDIPTVLWEEIVSRCSTDTEKTRACADYYVDCHFNASWEDLTGRLYWTGEIAAARKSKSFMSTGKDAI